MRTKLKHLGPHELMSNGPKTHATSLQLYSVIVQNVTLSFTVKVRELPNLLGPRDDWNSQAII